MNIFSSIEQAFVMACWQTMNAGNSVEVRGSKTRELIHYNLVVSDLSRLAITNPVRKTNVFAQVGELVWMFAGRDDMELLTEFIPSAATWSDNGLTWRGAYGPRLMSWPLSNSRGHFNQVETVIDLLTRDPFTRQAVISLWSPGS